MISVDQSIYTLRKDPRVASFLQCKVGANGLARQVDPNGDYIMLVDDVLYALPQYQYNALKRLQLPKLLSDALFNSIMQGQHNQLFSEQQLQRLQQIKMQYKHCTNCSRKKFRKQVTSMLGDNINKVMPPSSSLQYRSYPDIGQHQLPAVLHQSIHYPKAAIPRQPCFQCVQKHIGQAYIAGMQAQLGYPQHIMLVYGHLAQAIQQCPSQAEALKHMLILCLGVSRQQGKAFVPLTSLYACIKLYESKSSAQLQLAKQPNKLDQNYAIDLQLIQPAIQKLPSQALSLLYLKLLQLDTIQLQQTSTQYAQDRLRWIGAMASIAQLLLSVDSTAANIVRNLRILFAAAPQYMKQSQLNISVLIPKVKQCLTKLSSRPTTQHEASAPAAAPTK